METTTKIHNCLDNGQKYIINGTQTQYAHKKYLKIFYYIYYKVLYRSYSEEIQQIAKTYLPSVQN